MIQLSAQTIEFALVNYTIKEQFDLGNLYLFAGPVPANADAALDMVTMHTEIAHISSGNPGLRFAFQSGALVIDDSTDPWSTTAAFDGFDSSASSLQATFFRLCAPSSFGGPDDGRSAEGVRIQGTVGLVNTGADLKLGVTTYAPSDTVTVGTFNLRLFGG